MCENNGKAGACYEQLCAHCRPQPRPAVDPKRRTGRTSNAIKQAVFAAAFGRRVAYVCGTQQLADDACRYAAEYIAESLKELVVDQVTVRKDCIQFYFANGAVAGQIIFRGMGVEDNINRGVRTDCKYRIVRDHYVDELLAERAREEEKRADAQTIKALMRKHGWSSAEDLCNTGKPHKLVLRT